MLIKIPKAIRMLLVVLLTFVVASATAIFIGWFLPLILIINSDLAALIATLVFIILLIGLPMFIYGRLYPEYDPEQENKEIEIFNGIKLPKISIIWIVLMSLMFLVFILQPLSKKSTTSIQDIYIAVAALVLVISANKIFKNKYTSQQKQINKIIIIFLAIFLLAQLIL